jgi:3-oxoacyl-[acyl-carrier protein] reductase
MTISLDGAVAVVTGGAGGIGSAICRRLAGAGATVVATYRTSSGPAAQLIADLGGAPHIAVQASVTDPDALDELARVVETSFGRLDVIVNNAGITRPVARAARWSTSRRWQP